MPHFLRGILFWSTFVCLTLFLFVWLLMVVAYHSCFDKENLSSGAHRVAILWGRCIMILTPGWSYRLQGENNLPSREEAPVVMVANHQSAADIWALYLTGAQFRWLSKDAVFKVPLIGRAMRWAGYVPISRGSRGSHAAAMRASTEWLRKGISMVFFPEGTRSEDGQLKDFKVGAFKLAVEEKVDILPIAIRGTRNMVQKKGAAPRPAHLDIQILPRIKHLEGESYEDFASRVRGLFAAHLAQSELTRNHQEFWATKKAPASGPSLES